MTRKRLQAAAKAACSPRSAVVSVHPGRTFSGFFFTFLIFLKGVPTLQGFTVLVGEGFGIQPPWIQGIRLYTLGTQPYPTFQC